MKIQVFAAAALLVFSNLSAASPTVTGNTISWPNDGWYQVQEESNYMEVCGGGLSCDVEPGSYLVVNHTTGERFPGIEVGSDGGYPISVSGNTISWPDDGWYQIQDEMNYDEVCSGTNSCEVGDGSYLVVNHTTGQRFEGIVVPQQSVESFLPVNLFGLPDYASDELLNLEEENTLLAAAVAVANAEPLYTVRDFISESRPLIVADGSCPNGGSAIFLDRENGGCVRCSTIVDVTYQSCVIGNRELSGLVTILPISGGRDYIFDNAWFRYSDSESINYTGRYTEFSNRVGDNFITNYNWSGSWYAESRNSTISVNDFESEIITVNSGTAVTAQNFEISFGMNGTVTNGPSVSVNTLQPLTASVTDTYFQDGQLQMTEPAEHMLIIDLGTGDPGSVMKTLQSTDFSDSLVTTLNDDIRIQYIY